MAQASIGDLYVNGLTPIVSSALGTTTQVATVGGSITALSVLNFGTTALMVLVVDTTTVPSPGAVAPIWAQPIAGTSSTGPGAMSADWSFAPLGFNKGLCVLLSTVTTTPFTYTAATAVGFFSATVNTA